MHNSANTPLHHSTLRGYTGIKGLAFYENLLFNHNTNPPYSPIIAPHLKEFSVDNLPLQKTITRAKSDAIALRQLYSCPNIHQQHCPTQGLNKLLFEWFEQLRVEATCPRHLAGARQNLRIRFQQWSFYFFHSGMLEQQLMLLIFTTGQMLWARINNQVVVEMVDGVLEETRAGISSLVGKPIAEMKKNCHHQAEYAQISLALITVICSLIQKESAFKDSDNSNQHKKQKDINSWLAFSSEKEHRLYSQSMEYTASNANDHVDIEALVYPIFTTEFDTITSITKLVRHQQLLKYQQEQRQLPRSTQVKTNPNWLTRKLSQAFSCPQNALQNNHPMGLIDASKLVSLALSDSEENPFYNYQLDTDSQGQLTILLDCSGSMKVYIPWIIEWLSLFLPCAEKANLKTEVLGFTTRTWNGGRATKKWQQQEQNKQANPGRLNELSHIIFKRQQDSWHQTRLNLMGLLKADLFKEGIDGEAILWAMTRMQKHIHQYSEHKNALLVISDGHPMDSETMLNNPLTFLANHLNTVLHNIQKQTPINIIGIGLNEHLPPSFQKQVTFSTTDSITPQTLLPLIKQLSAASN